MIWLGGNTFYGRKQIFEPEFLAWLEDFQLPEYELSKRDGQYELSFSGPWMYTTLWEIPALAIINELRSRAAMRATQYDSETAQAFGIPVDRVYAGVFALGAMLAAIAAVLIVPISQAHYLMGQDPLLLSFIVVIIGGLGSLRGTIVAAVLIGLSDGIISMFFSPTLAKIIATLLVAMV